MRINVAIGDRNFRIGINDITKSIGWLQTEIIRRYSRSSNGEIISILELRTPDNLILDPSDQIFDVLKDNDTVLTLLKRSDETLRSGDMFQSRYFISKKLAEGSFGEVFIAKDLNLDREVAVKILKRKMTNETNIKRFMREARLTARLSNHPNIVSIYDFGRTDSGMFYLVMALLIGQCMDEWLEKRIIAKRPMSETECLHLFLQIADGLEAAHSHVPPIIHRDLKPDNVFLCLIHNVQQPKNSNNKESSNIVSLEVTDYSPKIMDFGIAVLDMEESKRKTVASGTRMYASPEQTQSVQIDTRSDIWSFGVMLYQCVSLLVDMPFDPIDIILNKTKVPDIRLHSLSPLSTAFSDLIMKCLQVNPDDRFNTVSDLRMVMKSILDWHHSGGKLNNQPKDNNRRSRL